MTAGTRARKPVFHKGMLIFCLIGVWQATATADDLAAPGWRTTNLGGDAVMAAFSADTTAGVPCGSDTLTQSNDPGTIGPDSVWCGNQTANAETSLARGFVAPYDLLLECVEFGVRTNSGGAWPVQVRVLQGTVTQPYAQLVLLASTTVQIPAGTNSQFFTANFSNLAITAGTSFVVELRTPSRFPIDGGDNALLSLACNALGQTAPSYLRGPACGANNFLTFQAIGFGHLSLVMTLGIETDNCIVCPEPGPNDLIENEPPCTNNLNGGCDFSNSNPPFMQLGGVDCGVCGTLWAGDVEMDRDWYYFDVAGAGIANVALTLYGSTSSGILCEVYSGNGTCGAMTLVPGGQFDHQCDEAPTTQVFALPAPGRYYVRVLEGTVLTGPTPPNPGNNCQANIADRYHLTASGIVGCVIPGTLALGKFRDDDCDGIWDPNEQGLAGWQLVVTNEQTGEQTTATTDASGGALLTLPLGNYTVTEVTLPGFRAPCQAIHTSIESPDVWGVAFIGNCPCPAQNFGIDIVCSPDWQVIATPPGGVSALPRPVNIVTPHAAWDQNVCWMSASANGNVSLSVGDYTYEYCFCLDERFTNPQLDLCVKADDASAVYLNGVFIGNGIHYSTAGCGPVMTNNPLLFRPGRNCVQIVVNNAQGPTGVSVSGVALATNGQCCYEECPCVPTPPDMTGWWMLDEASGATAFDDAGFANDGAHSGTPSIAAGAVNLARQYNGAGDYTEVANHADLNPGTGEFSIDAWIRTSSGSGYQVIVSKRYVNFTTGIDTRGFVLALDGGALRFDLATGPTFLDQEAFSFVGPNLADGRWHFVAATVRRNDSFGVKLYVDGVPQTFATGISGSLSNSAPLRIGSRTDTPQSVPGDYFDGAIDEVEFFKRALTPAEVWRIWRAGSNGKCRPIFDIGDLNCDGVISVGDIGAFVLALTDPANYELLFPACDINNADLNGDGFVTVGDIGPFVALLTGGS